MNLLHLIYPNGSIVPISYEDSINFNNNSEWRIGFCFPLAINYVILLYYDRKESLTDLSIHGTIINLQGKITTKDMVMLRHYNSSASTDYFIATYDRFPQSFLISYPKDGYLNWTKCTYSDDGIVTQVSYGSIRPVVDAFIFIEHRPFPTLDGQYAIVYLVQNASENAIYSIYAHFVNGQDQISEEHLLFQDSSSDNAINLVSLSGCLSGIDAFNIQSNGCTFNYYLISFAAPIMFRIATAFITFSSSGTVIQSDVISTDDLLNSSTVVFQAISFFQLPYGGFISINKLDLNESYYSQVIVYNLNYTSSYKLFEVVNETIVDYGIYSNNTLWFTYGNMTAGRKLVMLDVERFSNDSDYGNRVILSTYPTLNMTVPLSYTDHFNITLSVPVVPSSGNISIYQIVDQDKYLLRQTYPASSFCKLYNISTLTCKTLFSTFNRVNSNYTIVANDNFVKTLSFNEPLQGIYQGIWNVKTPQ
ncbi:4062_t:CDS:2, partial [Gigaspora rosea]